MGRSRRHCLRYLSALVLHSCPPARGCCFCCLPILEQNALNERHEEKGVSRVNKLDPVREDSLLRVLLSMRFPKTINSCFMQERDAGIGNLQILPSFSVFNKID
ncbi:hypothetical protein TNCT_659491 [Trichonephila clavata]|uniref:Secreted protein n=1 Tax=Trichonephila clavata TaxID=2740835 RepID=A0A8X6KI42_TRICU|nr:hypothetical protein TNCT_659491 [Trichonephila clavata]